MPRDTFNPELKMVMNRPSPSWLTGRSLNHFDDQLRYSMFQGRTSRVPELGSNICAFEFTFQKSEMPLSSNGYVQQISIRPIDDDFSRQMTLASKTFLSAVLTR